MGEPDRGAQLLVAVPYSTVLKVLRELDPADEHQRAAAESLMECLPTVLLARVEAARLDRP